MNVFENIEIASTYDSYYETEFGAMVDELEKKAISSFLIDIPHCELLELGCGTGHWTAFFSQLGYNVVAVDSSKAMLEIAHKKQIPNVQFIKADAHQLPFSNHSFNLIISITMLEFVNDISQTIQEIHRVLKPNGTLILGCLNKNSVLTLNKDQSETFRDAHFFTIQELSNLLIPFGKPIIKETVFIDEHYQFTNRESNGVFLAVKVKKEASL